MDVNAPNNLSRFTWLFGDDINKIKEVVQAVRVTDGETTQTIRQVYEDTGYLLDPHTAVGWRASDQAPSADSDIVVSTASPLKFAEEIFEKTGIRVDNSGEFEKLRQYPERYTEINNSIDELTEFLNQK